MDNYFNVLDYGVKQDCQELQTQAFQTAINACLKQGEVRSLSLKVNIMLAV